MASPDSRSSFSSVRWELEASSRTGMHVHSRYGGEGGDKRKVESGGLKDKSIVVSFAGALCSGAKSPGCWVADDDSVCTLLCA